MKITLIGAGNVATQLGLALKPPVITSFKCIAARKRMPMP